jgi:hypothetical protein
MLFKIVTFIAAAIPVVVFVRSTFFRRPTQLARMKEFKKDVDLVVAILLVFVGGAVVLALGNLVSGLG